ncbi:hypothetical protein CJF31_00006410 [Rutstroemia sp. NJR-2017a BVV2]|nr:hypothetical protein CJF31_00006410 [Rutstroemia sp. NJR-2017a BVV2]
MGGKPRNFGVREHRPSPLKQEVSQRPISTLPPQSPGLGLVRDPQFWKRFSTAVHMSEENLKELEAGLAGAGGRTERSDTVGSGNGSMVSGIGKRERKEKKEKIYGYDGYVMLVLFPFFANVELGIGHMTSNEEKITNTPAAKIG